MWYPYTKGMTPFERCKARWAMYARLGQGHAPGAVRGPPYNGRGTRSASRGGTAAVSGPHSISEGHVQLPQGGGHGQVGFYLGKAGGKFHLPLLPSSISLSWGPPHFIKPGARSTPESEICCCCCSTEYLLFSAYQHHDSMHLPWPSEIGTVQRART